MKVIGSPPRKNIFTRFVANSATRYREFHKFANQSVFQVFNRDVCVKDLAIVAIALGIMVYLGYEIIKSNRVIPPKVVTPIVMKPAPPVPKEKWDYINYFEKDSQYLSDFEVLQLQHAKQNVATSKQQEQVLLSLKSALVGNSNAPTLLSFTNVVPKAVLNPEQAISNFTNTTANPVTTSNTDNNLVSTNTPSVVETTTSNNSKNSQDTTSKKTTSSSPVPTAEKPATETKTAQRANPDASAGWFCGNYLTFIEAQAPLKRLNQVRRWKNFGQVYSNLVFYIIKANKNLTKNDLAILKRYYALSCVTKTATEIKNFHLVN